MVEMFRCSTTKDTTFGVCSANSSIQIPNIYTVRYATTKNDHVVMDIGWRIIILIRIMKVCRDTDFATCIYLVVYNPIFHIVR